MRNFPYLCEELIYLFLFRYSRFIEMLVTYFDKMIKIVFLYVGGLFFLKTRFRIGYLDTIFHEGFINMLYLEDFVQ